MPSVKQNDGQPAPAKRRKQGAQPRTDPAPRWEATRFFEQPKGEEKRPRRTLPTIQANGVVQRPTNAASRAAARPRFVVKKAENKAAGHADVGQDVATKNGAVGVPGKGAMRKPGVAAGGARQSGRKGQKRTRGLQDYAQHLQDMEETKVKMANLASRLIADPQQHVANLKHLRTLFTARKGRVGSLVLLTECQVYRDLAPAYRIRAISEKEAEVKVSKEVAQLRAFEQALLQGYQRFVRSCASLARGRVAGNVDTPAARDLLVVRKAACKALAELLRSLPHFNDAEVLVHAVCMLAADRDEEVRAVAVESLTALLADAHKASGHTLQTCVAIAKQLAATAGTRALVVPEEVVTPLSEIHFAGFAKMPPSKKGRNAPNKSKRFNRKRTNREKIRKEEGTIVEDGDGRDDVERDIAEGDADASAQEIYASRKALMDSVCHACFNIIKAASGDALEEKRRTERAGKPGAKAVITSKTRRPPPALSSALRGLLRVSRYVSVDIVEAIVAALTPMIEVVRYPLSIRLRCLTVAYAVVGIQAPVRAAQGDSAVSADTRALDVALYKAIGALCGSDVRVSEMENVTFDAMEAMVAARSVRAMPGPRAASFARRLATIATGGTMTHACTLGLMKLAQLVMDSTLVAPVFMQYGDGLRASVADDGMVEEFNLRAEDPDVAGGERSTALELSAMIVHFHPAVRAVARSCTEGVCGARMPKTGENVVMAAKAHATDLGGFNPPPVEKPPLAALERKRWAPEALLEDRMITMALTGEEHEAFMEEEGDTDSFFAQAWKEAHQGVDENKHDDCNDEEESGQ